VGTRLGEVAAVAAALALAGIRGLLAAPGGDPGPDGVHGLLEEAQRPQRVPAVLGGVEHGEKGIGVDQLVLHGVLRRG
jgi:hypothetical protein